MYEKKFNVFSKKKGLLIYLSSIKTKLAINFLKINFGTWPILGLALIGLMMPEKENNIISIYNNSSGIYKTAKYFTLTDMSKMTEKTVHKEIPTLFEAKNPSGRHI